MAGRARSNALRDELAKRARDTFDPDEGETQPTALDYVCYRLEGRTSLVALAEEIAHSTGYPIDDAMLGRHLRAQFGDSATDEAIDGARLRASHGYAEESMVIVDRAGDSGPEVSKAMARSRSRQWIAEKYNKAKYGQEKGLSVSISVGGLHLEALRATPSQPAITAAEVTGSFHEVQQGNSVTQQLLPQPQE